MTATGQLWLNWNIKRNKDFVNNHTVWTKMNFFQSEEKVQILNTSYVWTKSSGSFGLHIVKFTRRPSLPIQEIKKLHAPQFNINCMCMSERESTIWQDVRRESLAQFHVKDHPFFLSVNKFLGLTLFIIRQLLDGSIYVQFAFLSTTPTTLTLISLHNAVSIRDIQQSLLSRFRLHLRLPPVGCHFCNGLHQLRMAVCCRNAQGRANKPIFLGRSTVPCLILCRSASFREGIHGNVGCNSGTFVLTSVFCANMLGTMAAPNLSTMGNTSNRKPS